MPPRKSAFRQPGARHFQLVHRSQRDPLYQDPEASQRVLKEFERENPKKGKSRADLEAYIPPQDLKHDLERENIGEASLYGIYYDDTSYDYMQHLKQAGGGGDGDAFESVLLEGPSRSSKKGNASLALRDDLPMEALPSAFERPRNYEDQEAIPSSIAGFQPDMDPHLRQTLEALEDDAFVDDGLEDDFFGELIADGEREVEEVEYDFDEDGFADAFAKAARLEASGSDQPDDAEGWENRFAAFKKAQAEAPTEESASDLDGPSEGGDTVGTLPRLSVIGGKRRRKGTSDASGYSMSSSSMFRNEGLTTLDERFDQLEREYAEDEEPSDDETTASDDDEEAPELITSREDFDAMMDDFLDNYEILGRKMKPVLPGNTPAEKLESYRRAFLEGGQIQVRDAADDDDDGDILQPVDLDDRADRWDCETILSTYSNLENHPRIIRARDTKRVPKIQLNPRTGLPSVVEQHKRQAKTSKAPEISLGGQAEEDEDSRPKRVTITRAKNESKEEKKARKAATKAEKQTRRVDKKANKEMFASAFKEQNRVIANQDERRVHAM